MKNDSGGSVLTGKEAMNRAAASTPVSREAYRKLEEELAALNGFIDEEVLCQAPGCAIHMWHDGKRYTLPPERVEGVFDWIQQKMLHRPGFGRMAVQAYYDMPKIIKERDLLAAKNELLAAAIKRHLTEGDSTGDTFYLLDALRDTGHLEG